ncbi:lysoplasmalogenase [Choloepus didactylus]|uniref:lysoplasmalogenase n=1 Tax=Choloepus didactylus TaxID=27675 RepID=UPI0018A086BD|nr:lysoplasmalogenase [Choloepus didactylus]
MDTREMVTPRNPCFSAQSPHIARWLSPFFLACAFYFLIWVPEDQPLWVSALVKGLPVLCLVVFLGAVAPEGGSTPLFQGGLLCSFVGDACLVWPEAFLYGMAAFAAAHLLYLAALGFSPLRPGLLLPVLLPAGAFLGLLRPHLPPALAAPVAAYSLLMALVLWRGLARRGGAGRGALLFAFSDALLAWDTFVRPLPRGRLLVMASYYAGQAFLARSAVGSPRRRAR